MRMGQLEGKAMRQPSEDRLGHHLLVPRFAIYRDTLAHLGRAWAWLKDAVEFCAFLVFIIVVCYPLFVAMNVNDWCMNRWNKPWRIEGCGGDYSAKKWKDCGGSPSLDAAIHEAMNYRANTRRMPRDRQITWRVRHWLSRNYIMADIL